MRRCWILALVGCGRLGFDPTAHDAGGDSGDGSTSTAVRVAYLKASNTDALDDFGYAIALSADGSTLAVGAPQEDSPLATTPNDNSASNAGAVYVFARTDVTWTQQAYLKATSIGAGDLFGAALALSSDGNTLVVTAVGEDSATAGVNTIPDEGAADSGAAYIFVRSGTTWSQQAYLKASNTDAGDHYGQAAAISANADVVAIGADLEASGGVGVNSNQANNLAAGSGAVYVYTRSGTTWIQDEYIKPSNTGAGDGFGFALALSADGTTLVVGASAEDSGNALDPLDNTQPEAGAAYVFARSGTTWIQDAYLKSSLPTTGDFFARRLSLSASGDVLLCSGAGEDAVMPNSGAAYVLTRSGTAWTETAQLEASNAGDNDQFGSDVALAGDGNTLIVGAAFEDSSATGSGGNQLDNSSMDSGAVYAFDRVGTTWTQFAYAKPPMPSPGDTFGFATAISDDGRTKAASMPMEDSATRMVNGDASNDSAQDAGAVIITYY